MQTLDLDVSFAKIDADSSSLTSGSKGLPELAASCEADPGTIEDDSGVIITVQSCGLQATLDG